MPTLWVDADACPKVAREIIVRAAERTTTPTWFVANHSIPLPPSKWVKSLPVSHGFDAADNEIVARLAPGDLLISSDLPLAMEAIDKGAAVMTTRGEMLDKNNIRAKVQLRDFMETMRSSGEHTGGPKGYSDTDRREFANALDRWLAKNR
ncbi:YaiI/YqxD family protein [Billgrantia desiderata]|uniref:UPF0178 protein HOP60_19085 n=1 Tax=Billgrantia desiderata TaxID=52021 RepID=A0ABS9B9K8_9GAMM|nr:YaiI/YqxD family protein [Halomonas desiderata]MCE8011841.1 YaiI/YqxD family protein [Halomonas desiderata]MCE8044258.1 YaiI/YqxD family protein [Halomonas desiderata]MCE8048832.1 YaiI/YqxD family protein [Halomonas desiderata]